MANSRNISLGVYEPKKNVAAVTAGSADQTVSVTYDRDVNQQTVIAALEKIREYIIEQEYAKNV